MTHDDDAARAEVRRAAQEAEAVQRAQDVREALGFQVQGGVITWPNGLSRPATVEELMMWMLLVTPEHHWDDVLGDPEDEDAESAGHIPTNLRT